MSMKKRSKPDCNTPPKAKDKKYRQDDDVCLICESTIAEDNDNQSGDDAISMSGVATSQVCWYDKLIQF